MTLTYRGTVWVARTVDELEEAVDRIADLAAWRANAPERLLPSAKRIAIRDSEHPAARRLRA